MVGQLYPKNDHRIDGAFTIFIWELTWEPSFLLLFVAIIGDTGNIADFKYGFLAAAIGMLVSTISFEVLKNKHLKDPEGKPLGMPKQKNGCQTYGVILGSID